MQGCLGDLGCLKVPEVPGVPKVRTSAKLVSSPEAGVAQLVEQLIRNQQVSGSSPLAGSIFPQKIRSCRNFGVGSSSKGDFER